MVKASASKAAWICQRLIIKCPPCQEPGVIGTGLRLVGPVSVYCDWVRKEV